MARGGSAMHATMKSARRHLLKLALTYPLLGGLSGCYTLTRRDIFEVAFDRIPGDVLIELSDADHTFHELPLHAAGRSVSAYWDRGSASRGVLVFFNGNGYGAEVAARRMLVPARALGLDLLVFNYVDRGAPTPTMTEMRGIAHALCDAAARLGVPAASSVYAGGHSLGATFVLEVAASATLAGAFIAAPFSTGVDMLHHQIAITRFALLRP